MWRVGVKKKKVIIVESDVEELVQRDLMVNLLTVERVAQQDIN